MTPRTLMASLMVLVTTCAATAGCMAQVEDAERDGVAPASTATLTDRVDTLEGVTGSVGQDLSPDAPACGSAADCDDGNPCTLDYCTVNGCSNPETTELETCGTGGSCWKGACCEAPSCIDLSTMACVAECPAGKACGADGVCIDG